jgi:hypothetical protein
VENPVYHFNYAGIVQTLRGPEQIKALYAMWAQTHQAIFWVPDEQVAVADNFVATIATGHQQTLGAALIANDIEVDDPEAYYVYKNVEQLIWPYDDRGRLVGEDVWEANPDGAEITKMDAADVTTTEEAGALLAPFIKPLPSFDETVLRKVPAQRC